MKISIMMPTYNDCESICHTLDSIKSQSYLNWELIIINDGSTDDTDNTIKSYIKENKLKEKIKYIKQENTDQLLALMNGSQYITGDYIYILHSDDLFASDDALKVAVEYLEKHPDLDGILPDYLVIDDNDNITGKQKLLKYKNTDSTLATCLLWMGRNLYSDFPMLKKDVFLTKVKENYLTWNRPFWLCMDKKPGMLNIKNVPFCVFKYRVYEGNYANNEVGLLCLINGELRVATTLMKFYSIPFYRLQMFIYKCFSHLHLFSIYRPLFFKKETKNKAWLVDYIIKQRYPEGYDNIFFNNLVGFFKNTSKRTIDFDKLFNKTDIVYEGNRLRMFNKQIVNNELPQTYINVLNEMGKGFTKVKVSKQNKENAEKILKFLCIYYFVEVVEK